MGFINQKYHEYLSHGISDSQTHHFLLKTAIAALIDKAC